MTTQTLIGRTTAVLGIVSLLCLGAYYLALHDIYHDYASPTVPEEEATVEPGALPGWTACALEWRIVRVGFWLMVLFHIVFLAGLGWRARYGREGGEA